MVATGLRPYLVDLDRAGHPRNLMGFKDGTTAKRVDGTPVIARDSQIRLAAPATNGGQKILRRGYSNTDGTDPNTGLHDAGLFFIAFQQDPHRQFVAIQRQLAENDALNEYIRHPGSGLFAVRPGLTGPGRLVGQGTVRLSDGCRAVRQTSWT